MTKIKSKYIGDLRTENIHIQSNSIIITDAPTDNLGKGEAFSPTDLLATALSTCILTTIAISARNYDFTIEGTTANVTKIMATDPRRVGEIIVEINFCPNNYSEKDKVVIERAASKCPVAASLSPDVKKTLIFNY